MVVAPQQVMCHTWYDTTPRGRPAYLVAFMKTGNVGFYPRIRGAVCCVVRHTRYLTSALVSRKEERRRIRTERAKYGRPHDHNLPGEGREMGASGAQSDKMVESFPCDLQQSSINSDLKRPKPDILNKHTRAFGQRLFATCFEHASHIPCTVFFSLRSRCLSFAVIGRQRRRNGGCTRVHSLGSNSKTRPVTWSRLRNVSA